MTYLTNYSRTESSIVVKWKLSFDIYIYAIIAMLYMQSLQCKLQEINFQSQRDFKFGAIFG